MDVSVTCEIESQAQLGEFISCQEFTNLQLVDEARCKTRFIKLNVTMTNSFDTTIYITPDVSVGESNQSGESNAESAQKLAVGNEVVEQFGFPVNICEYDSTALLTISATSYWFDEEGNTWPCDQVSDKWLFPTALNTPTTSPIPTLSPTLSSKPSLPPSQQPTINVWKQVGAIIDSSSPKDECGYAVDISSDGRKVVIGCPGTQVNGLDKVGSVQLYRLSSDDNGVEQWVNLNVGINGRGTKDYTGISVAYAAESDIFAVGEFAQTKGRVRVFELKDNGSIEQVGSDIDLNLTIALFKLPIDLSGDGRQLVVGSGIEFGSVKIFEFNGFEWKVINTYEGEINEVFGIDVDLSANKGTLSLTTFEVFSGFTVVKVYDLPNDDPFRIKVSTPSSDDPVVTSLSGDGLVCAIGAPSAELTKGKVVFYSVKPSLDLPIELGRIEGEMEGDSCGKSIDLSYDGKTAAIGCVGKVYIAVNNGTGFNIVKSLETQSSTRTIIVTRKLELESIGYPVAISGSGDSIITGSGIIGDLQSGAEVFGSPAAITLAPTKSPTIAPQTTTPTIASASPSSPGGIGKGKGKGKGKSKKPKGSKGKGKKKSKGSKGGSKGKKNKACKKSKGKNYQNENECIGREQCNASSDLKALDVSFEIISTRNETIDEAYLNSLLCNTTDTNARRMRKRLLNDAMTIQSIFVSDVRNKTQGKSMSLYKFTSSEKRALKIHLFFF